MSKRFFIGRFEIRPDERRVAAEGADVVLGARAFDLLLCLVERRDRVVSKDELLECVWPRLVVEETPAPPSPACGSEVASSR
jgi:DNA-binding winged helix-turn-helix (wHTH) protein